MTLVRALVVLWAVAAGIQAAAPERAEAAPRRAEVVIDARTGQVLHARDAEVRLPPASLTKMMTLYLVFEAIERGRLDLDQQVTVSAHAARQPPTKVGFKAGQRVRLRDVIRTAAVRSANDSAVVLAEAVAGSEARFAELMTRRAREIGMPDSTFRNASGLTANGHLSTARDMAHLGRRLFYDFPEYYGLFGRPSTEAFGRRIFNTNKLLNSYRGADGIKTGYTRAAGFNLVASAERGERRVIAALFGGTSSGARNARVAELLDLGFREAPARAREVPPDLVASAAPRVGDAVDEPVARPAAGPEAAAAERAFETALASLAGVRVAPAPAPRPTAEPATPAVAEGPEEPDASLFERGAAALGRALGPSAAQAAETPRPPAPERMISVGLVSPTAAAPARAEMPTPRRRNGRAVAGAPAAASASTAGDWAVQLGAYAERDVAVARLAAAAFGVMPALATAGREIHVASMGDASIYRARLTGLDAATAREACRRLESEGRDCLAIPPAR